MNNKKIFVFFMSIILVLSSCIKKGDLSAEENLRELTDMKNTDFLNEIYIERKDYLIELIRKVPYPDEPWELYILKETESFLELEKYSEELLIYAFELFQEEALTRDEKTVVAYVLLGIDFDKYKYFLRDLAVLFVDGKIERHITGLCFFPIYPGYGAYKNDRDPVIREALEILLKSERGWPNDETKASIRNRLMNSEMSEN